MSAFAQDDFASRAAALAARAEAPRPEAWRPDEEGHPSVLVGQLVEWQRRPSGYDPERKVDIAILRDPQGREWAIWGHGAVLEGEFAELRERPNESAGVLVAVHYEGLVEKPGGRPYKSYRVVVDRQRVEQTAAERPAESHADALRAPRCEQCGYAEPEHAAGCPDDSIPF